MPATRVLPTEEAVDLLRLVRDLATRELLPRAAEAEAEGAFPRDVFATLGRAGLLGLPYAEEHGGGGQPYEVYLQVLEEIASVWASVGVGVSVHALSCFGLVTAGTDEQRERWLPDMLGGDLLGAYCLSEAHAGSDPAAMRTSARRDGDDYVLNGAKAWTTHGGRADFYKVMARTSDDRNGISCFLVPADAEGLSADPPERKMGLTGSATATMRFDGVRVPVERRLGAEGDGLRIALAGLDSGRLGIAAVATGLAQAAVDHATAYAKEREAFGRPIMEHQGLAFVLADMEAAVQSARATLLHAARLRDRGLPFSREASIAKLVATDNAMRVTTDAVQVLGGYGYTRDFPVERFMREAKVMQIFEGTNQIQRMVIARSLAKGDTGQTRAGGPDVTAPLVLPYLVLAAVLLISGVAKLADKRATEDMFVSLRVPLLPAAPSARVLPYAEIALGLGLLVVPAPAVIVRRGRDAPAVPGLLGPDRACADLRPTRLVRVLRPPGRAPGHAWRPWSATPSSSLWPSSPSVAATQGRGCPRRAARRRRGRRRLARPRRRHRRADVAGRAYRPRGRDPWRR